MTATTAVKVTDHELIEYNACAESSLYFTDEYCMIYDVVAADWIPFHLWPAQARAMMTISNNLLVVILKARQIGMTWLALAYALWLMIFYPIATVLLFSVGDTEAKELMRRLKGMYQRLPFWMRPEVTADNMHEFGFSNGSIAKALPSTGGDSFTATYVVLDEFDINQNQGDIMRSVKPTITNGGQLVMLSRPDKNRPQTQFKKIFKAAQKGLNDYAWVFLPWLVHPNRDEAWYEAERRDILTRTGSEDELHEQYPETVEQALAANFAALVYPTFSETENVTEEAEYNPAWPIYWGVDDGYAYGQGPGHYDYHPRVILFAQFTPIGGVNIFAERYVCLEPDYNMSIDAALTWWRYTGDKYPYVIPEYILSDFERQQLEILSIRNDPLIQSLSPDELWLYLKAYPELACVDSSAKMLRAALSARGISNIGATHRISEGIKNVRRFILDGNGVRLAKTHPRCENFIREKAGYKFNEKSTRNEQGERIPLKLDDHGTDAERYLMERKRLN